MIDCRIDNVYSVYVHIVPRDVTGYVFDKYYVGITKTSVDNRWKNGLGYKKQVFYRAIFKYGWDNIRHEVIAEHLTRKEACHIEVKLIKILQSNISQYGYNITEGGDIGLSGVLNPRFGIAPSEETKRKMRLNHADVSGYKNGNAKEIFQFNYDGDYIKKYSCGTDAANDLKVSPKTLTSAARNNEQSCGFMWSFKDNVVLDSNGKYKMIEMHGRYKSIYQFDKLGNFLRVYDTIKDASEITGINSSTISKVAMGKMLSCYDFIWRYKKDIDINDAIIIPKDIYKKSKVSRRNNKLPVFQFDLDGKYVCKYNTIEDVISDNSFYNKSFLLMCLRGDKPSAYGYLWKNGNEIDFDENKSPCIHYNNLPYNPYRVFQFDMNKNFIRYYHSCLYASQMIDVDSSCISECANHKLNTSAGYIWRYISDIKESADNVGSFIIVK